MAEQRPLAPTDAAIEAGLRDLAGAIDYPTASAEISALVGERLRRQPPRAGLVTLPALVLGARRRRTRVAFLLAAALLVLLAAVVVAAVIGLPGIRIVLLDRPLPTPSVVPTASTSASTPALSPATPTALGGTLLLGTPIATEQSSLDAAAGRHVLVPPGIGRPMSAWLETRYGPSIVSLVWRATTSLPDTTAQLTGDPSGIGAVLTEIPVTIQTEYLEKVVGSGGTVDRVTVAGQPGFFITGAPHEIVLFGPNGEEVPSTTRLAGSSLLWEQGGLTLRLETGLDRAGAVALGASVR